MYIRRKLVPIDTEDKTAPGAYCEESTDVFTPEMGDEINTQLYTRQHLYVVTDDPHDIIKDGEWYLVKINFGHGGKYIEESLAQFKSGQEELFKQYDGKKVVACTNESLGLPTLDDLFLDGYCNAYVNNLYISEILVKYSHNGRYWNTGTDKWDDRLTLVVSDSNTINPIPIKQKWNRDELVDLLEEFKKQKLTATEFLKSI